MLTGMLVCNEKCIQGDSLFVLSFSEALTHQNRSVKRFENRDKKDPFFCSNSSKDAGHSLVCRRLRSWSIGALKDRGL